MHAGPGGQPGACECSRGRWAAKTATGRGLSIGMISVVIVQPISSAQLDGEDELAFRGLRQRTWKRVASPVREDQHPHTFHGLQKFLVSEAY